MTGSPEQALLELEVRALTDLLRSSDSTAGLRNALIERTLDPSETMLVGLIEGEDQSTYGVLLTASGDCIVFEADRNDLLSRWEEVRDITSLERDFQAVAVGVAMRRLGQMS